jgi:hypothetical protein
MNAKKHAVVLVVVLLLAIGAYAQTNLITFTNKAGEVISNAPIISVNAIDLFYEVPGGGARVHLADLPPDLQQRFGYDPVKAQAATQKIQEIHQAQAAAAVDAAQSAAETKARQAYMAKVLKTKVNVYGRIIQNLADGTMLVDSGSECFGYEMFCAQDGTPGAWGICLLVGCNKGIEGEKVNVIAYPNGVYSYTTVSSASKTVRRYTLNPNWVMQPASESDMQLITHGFPRPTATGTRVSPPPFPP